MKRPAASVLAAAVLMLLSSEPAHANEPPAPQTMLAQIVIVPMAFALFAFSGAAALWDRRKSESLKKAGKVRKHSLRRGRLRVLGIVTLACILSGMHEGYALLLSTALGVYAIVLAVRMIRVSGDAPPGGYSRWAPRVAGGLLIPLAVFLASFSLAFFSMVDTYRYPGSWYYLNAMEEFWRYQENHARSHGGAYLKIQPQDLHDVQSDQQRVILQESRAFMLHDAGRGETTRRSITYGGDTRGYEIRITPVGFLPWPYRWFTSRKAFYMDQTGVIRHETMRSRSKEATAESPALKKLSL